MCTAATVRTVRATRPSGGNDAQVRDRTRAARAGELSGDELRTISQKSVEVLAGMSPRAQWLQSYVTDDHIYCVYMADNPEAIREHAECGGFPVTNINRVRAVSDPSTAEG